jgi:hypothetical protein
MEHGHVVCTLLIKTPLHENFSVRFREDDTLGWGEEKKRRNVGHYRRKRREKATEKRE